MGAPQGGMPNGHHPMHPQQQGAMPGPEEQTMMPDQNADAFRQQQMAGQFNSQQQIRLVHDTANKSSTLIYMDFILYLEAELLLSSENAKLDSCYR